MRPLTGKPGDLDLGNAELAQRRRDDRAGRHSYRDEVRSWPTSVELPNLHQRDGGGHGTVTLEEWRERSLTERVRNVTIEFGTKHCCACMNEQGRLCGHIGVPPLCSKHS